MQLNEACESLPLLDLAQLAGLKAGTDRGTFGPRQFDLEKAKAKLCSKTRGGKADKVIFRFDEVFFTVLTDAGQPTGMVRVEIERSRKRRGGLELELGGWRAYPGR